jgi:inosine-uridine nucleoside N-ribohydrolase
VQQLSVHLDTDIGGDIDDLCALALLLAWPGVELTGVTTVLDDGGRRAGYARFALALAGRSDVPVAAGADVRLGRFRLPAGLPPEARYWPAPVPAAPGPLEAALDLLQRSIERGAVVAGIGPFTNLCLLERRTPGILRRATICLMGGHLQPPPPGYPAWDYQMDYNVQADPDAARQVLEAADAARTTLVPIELTAQTALTRAQLPALRRAGALGQLIAHQAEAFAQDERLAERYGPTCPGLPDGFVNFQHDPLACAVALGWPGVTVETLPLALDLEGEWLRERIDAAGRGRRVATGVGRAEFDAFWLAVVTGSTGRQPSPSQPPLHPPLAP